MVMLVGVVNSNDGSPSRKCEARRLLPLNIEPDLTMVMALDEFCMACGSDPKGLKATPSHDVQTFIRNFRSLSKDEAHASLMVTSNELTNCLGQVVSCVGCRRAVETLYQTLVTSGDSALQPLVVSDDGVVSVNREHLEGSEESLANLLVDQSNRLTKSLCCGDGGKNKSKRGGSGRCAQHTLGTKKSMNPSNWLDTWDCLEQECKEEVVLLPYSALEITIDKYLKKHRFCKDCSIMVRKAYTLLKEEGEDCAEMAGEKSDKEYKTDNGVFNGISICSRESHIHVQCDAVFIDHLMELAEPELSGFKQERHAKTIEIAQKEILICIGITLYNRFERIQQKLQEAEQTCDLLFLICLQSLRRSMEMAAENKRGVSDLELFCQELDKEEQKKANKRDRKKKAKARKRENNKIRLEEQMEESSDNNSQSGDRKSDFKKEGSTSSSSDKENEEFDKALVAPCSTCKVSAPRLVNVPDGLYGAGSCSKEKNKNLWKPREQTRSSLLSLTDLLDDNDYGEEEIPQEDIRSFLDNLDQVKKRRQQLRDNLKQRFAALCDNGGMNIRVE